MSAGGFRRQRSDVNATDIDPPAADAGTLPTGYTIEPGDVLFVRHWDHCERLPGNDEFTMRFVAGKHDVAVMLLLGKQARDGSAPLDLEQCMRRLGWQKIG